MSKYIDADVIEKYIQEVRDKFLTQAVFSIDMEENAIKAGVLEAVRSLLDILPDADVEEVKHGRWILGGEIGWPKWTCTVCGGDGSGDYKICPWCGVKMDADDNYCDDENCEIYQRDLNCERCTK